MMNNKLNNEVKIMSMEGSSILKNNLQEQVIDKTYNINFNKSLLLNKLIENGMNVTKGCTTRDIINVRFSYGYDIDINKIEQLHSQIEELKQINKDSVDADKNYGSTLIASRRKDRKANRDIIKQLEGNIKDLKLSKDETRTKLYEDGFFLDYYKVKKDDKKRIVRDENGKKVYELSERVEYLYWFRTSAKARVGEVFFINKNLLHSINHWQQMGIEFGEDEQCKLIEMEAYKALTASSLEGVMEINSRTDILVIDDLLSFSNHKCKLVKTDKDCNCYVESDNNYKLKNELFDGQSLIEKSLMDDNELTRSKGGVLLRGHMFKSFAVSSNIQKFMKDFYKDDYDTAYIVDRYGRDIKVTDIKFISTENSMKWEKFEASMEDWVVATESDDNLFGIVKTEKASKYDNLQRMSYQMLNTLDPERIDLNNILSDTLEYTESIKNDIHSYIEYLNATQNDTNINKMLIDLYAKNENIVGTELFRDYKKYQIRDWKDRLKSGKILINGDNLTIVGNPYLMLLHSVGEVNHIDNVVDSNFIDLSLSEGNTCYTKRFNDREELAVFRNPHNAPNNIYSAVNTKLELMDEYFNFTDNIVAINLLNTDLQDRLNGSDQDSDFVLTTNQADIVNFAKESQLAYPTIVNRIEEDTRQYENNMTAMASVDNALSKSKNDIGITSNIAQIALSWYMNSKSEELADTVCISSVLAQVAIDNAKRKYSVNLEKQIRKIRKLECMDIKINNKVAKPSFWEYTSKSFDKKKHSSQMLDVNCVMCILTDKINDIKDSKRIKSVDICDLLDNKISNKYKYEQIQSIQDKYKDYKNKDLYLMQKIRNTSNKEYQTKLIDEQKDNTIKISCEVAKLKVNKQNMKALIKRFADHKNDIDADLLNLLYSKHQDVFLEVFVEDGKGVK